MKIKMTALYWIYGLKIPIVISLIKKLKYQNVFYDKFRLMLYFILTLI